MIKNTALYTFASLCFLLSLSPETLSESINKDFINDNPPAAVIIIPRPVDIIGLRTDEETGIVTSVSQGGDPAGIPYSMGRIDFTAEVIDPETGEVLCRIGDYFRDPE